MFSVDAQKLLEKGLALVDIAADSDMRKTNAYQFLQVVTANRGIPIGIVSLQASKIK